jgi:hypothetical protein
VLKCCIKCQAVQYCSKSCQKRDWKKQHEKICQFLNVGDGAVQVQIEDHKDNFENVEEQFQGAERSCDEDGKRFFKLFTESTREGSRAAALEMKKIAARQTRLMQIELIFIVYPFLCVPTRKSFDGPTVHFASCFNLSIPTCVWGQPPRRRHQKNGREKSLHSTI